MTYVYIYIYIDLLAKINIFRNTAHFDHWNPEEVSKHVPTGNSREQPSPFLYYCSQGCAYASWRPELARSHAVNCKGPKQNEANESHDCSEDGCGATYTNRNSLAVHMWRKHNFKPRKCGKGCSEEESPIFITSNEYKNHVTALHDDLEEPTKCPLADDCRYDKVFTKRTSLRTHLHNIHEITIEDMPKYVEKAPEDPELKYKKPSDPFESKCVILGCQSQVTFKGRSLLRAHLLQVHKKTQDEARELVPLSETWKARDKPAPMERMGCPMEGCKSKQAFNGPASLRNHLMAPAHKMTKENAEGKAAEAFGKAPRKSKASKNKLGENTNGE